MLKSYDELRKIDVSPFCEERDKVLYLPYNKCIDLLHKHGAEKVFSFPYPILRTGAVYMNLKPFLRINQGTQTAVMKPV